MEIEDIFDGYDDTDEKLRMQEFIRKNKDKMPKLTPEGERKVREGLKDVEFGYVQRLTKGPDRYEKVIIHGEYFGNYRLLEKDSVKGMRESVFDKKTGDIISEAYTN